jgi:glycine cleavage system regulatory protein
VFSLPTHLKRELGSVLSMIDLIRIAKYGCNLLESKVPRIREEEPCTDRKYISWDNETQLKFPADISAYIC